MRTTLSLIAASLLLIGAGCVRATPATNSVPVPEPLATEAPAITPNAPPPTEPPPIIVVPPVPPPAVVSASEQPAAPRVIRVTAKQWEFVPTEVRVRNGEPVVLEVTSMDVEHGLSLPDFGINRTLKPGITERIAFTPDKVGTFSMVCSVFCGAGPEGRNHRSMRGTLIVE